MGEAKRRKRLAQQASETLRQRIAAGEFGAPGRLERLCLVIDRSPAGRDLLALLRTMPEFGVLHAALAGEEMQLWDSVTLFEFAGITLKDGRSRAWLATDEDKLLHEALPRELRGGAGLLACLEPALQERVASFALAGKAS
ncbi:MAG: hypothetical protein KatS3mg122_1780 [Caldimonas sp.]|nr:MAG: hypothetical protein KatS3mg122_1780 [Caldimonas sp.]